MWSDALERDTSVCAVVQRGFLSVRAGDAQARLAGESLFEKASMRSVNGVVLGLSLTALWGWGGSVGAFVWIGGIVCFDTWLDTPGYLLLWIWSEEKLGWAVVSFSREGALFHRRGST